MYSIGVCVWLVQDHTEPFTICFLPPNSTLFPRTFSLLTQSWYQQNYSINMLHWLHTSVQFSSVQSISRIRLFATSWIAARQASLFITISRSSLRLNVHRVRDAIQPSHPLSSPSPPAPNPSHHQSLFQWVNSLHEVAKVLEFQL